MAEKKFTSLKEFYPFYLSEHTNTTSRVLHFIGTGLVVLAFFCGLSLSQLAFLPAYATGGLQFRLGGAFLLREE